jgi:hypothetical protein
VFISEILHSYVSAFNFFLQNACRCYGAVHWDIVSTQECRKFVTLREQHRYMLEHQISEHAQKMEIDAGIILGSQSHGWTDMNMTL